MPKHQHDKEGVLFPH